MWFSSVQDARYLLPAMPVLAVLAAVGIVALARQGKLGRMLAIVGSVVGLRGRRRRLGRVRVAVRPVSRRPPRARTTFLRENVSYHESVEWLNANLPPDSRVVVDHAFLLHIEPDALTWTSDALRTTAGPEETREFVRRYGVDARDHLRGEHRPRIASSRTSARAGSGDSLARPISSRTRHEVGAPQRMDVYELPRPR